MNTSYMKRSLMLLGAAAFVATAGAEGTFVDVTNQYIKEATYMPGWQGVVTASSDGVAEIWNGAFRLYQVFNNMPAGEYTLSCNAFYRCGNNDFSKANMPTNADLYKAYIFVNDNQKKVAGLFDGRDTAPNGRAEANAAFSAGEYANELTVNHPGGDMVIGIANTGCYDDEWCCFDNFKLVGPEGEVAIENGDFSTGVDSKRAWNNVNSENKEKTPDMQKDGAGGGDYRKCGGSPYKYGQQVELPAGKYRFGMLTFHRYGSTVSPDGTYYHHKSGEVVAPYGGLERTPKDWFEAKDYDQAQYDHAYIFMSKSEECPKDMNFGDPEDPFAEGCLFEGDVRTRIKDCWELCNGDYSIMPDNNVYGKDATLAYETFNKCIYWHDSGNEREAAAAFVNDPERYYQYVEFELSAPTKVWLGLGKNSNTSDGYWHAWADQTLKKYVETSAVEGIEADENAPVEYYNLQGVRVAEPANGIFIVKKGNKATKQIFK